MSGSRLLQRAQPTETERGFPCKVVLWFSRKIGFIIQGVVQAGGNPAQLCQTTGFCSG
jgi:hypothetical protein